MVRVISLHVRLTTIFTFLKVVCVVFVSPKKLNRGLIMDLHVIGHIMETLEKRPLPMLALFHSELLHYLEAEGKGGMDAFEKVVGKLRTNSEKLLFIHRKLTQFNLLEHKYLEDAKDDSKAIECKDQGNKFYCKARYTAALQKYTKVIMRAQSKELLAIGYANRSAALFNLKYYRECLTDIARALGAGYPEAKQAKLTQRRVNATQQLAKSKRTPNFHEEVPTFASNKRNPTMPCATSSVAIRASSGGRKKVIAIKTINIGDLVAVEEPLISMIGEAYLYHCHECYILCYNPIPCDGCTQALYCGTVCKDKAFLSYHRYECPIALSVRTLMGRKSLFLPLALKALLQSGDQLPDEFYQLIQQAKDQRFHEQPQLELAAAAMYELSKTHTDRFSGPNGARIEKIFKDNITALLQICVLQTSAVDELCPKDDGSRMVLAHDTIAMGIFQFFAMFRHSCAPNVMSNFYGTKRVVRAIRTIRSGQELFISYGTHYIQDKKEERQFALSMQYHFTCTCRACAEDWSQVEEECCGHMHTLEDSNFMHRMKRRPDVELAKRVVPQKVVNLRLLEKMEPHVVLTMQQKLLLHCYDVLGNKRMLK